jgi:DNA (cytosine-5)-methyltransferase 1
MSCSTQIYLQDQVKMLPTPRATDGDKGSRTAQGAAKEWARGRNKDLGMVVAMWPTPQASDNRDRGNLGSGAILRRKEKGKQIGLSQSVSDQSGALNPPWVEWLMAWPIEWTDLNPLETARFRAWRLSHGESSVNPPPKK